MSLKKRSKVSAQFNMSSLTDIIFLLLIFFMLTSSLVAPNSLNLKIPGSSNAAKPPSKVPDEIGIGSKGTYYWNNRRINLGDLEAKLERKVRISSKKYAVIIAPRKNAPVESVVEVMDIAMRLDINGVLNPEE